MSKIQLARQEHARLAQFEQLCLVLYNKNIDAVAKKAGVHWTTIYKWLDGTTYAPRIHTLVKVANVVGYDFKLVRRK